MFNQLVKNRQFNLFLLASLIFSILIVPATAEAGILGSILNAVRPYAKFAGKIAGAVAGASLCAAFVPPLGMIAGGIAGWIVGGIVTSYGTGSLSNLAALGGAAAGVMALASFGPVGYVAGALVGGFLGKIAMSLLYKADREATGGILFMTGGSSPATTSGVALSPEVPMALDNAAPVPVTSGVPASAVTIAPTSDEIQAADTAYRNAYQAYISATREGNSQNISATHKSYLQALEDYKKLTGKDPQ
ncbi:MAG: hypothetical protein A2W80_17930 [Candidatus Riflebacteria bacterium GWC2_50_8]|nr:MAG: hypothetical protein A2W80_17930 [Candidatus Riflebacteria bacterium GWC2_50_8]